MPLTCNNMPLHFCIAWIINVDSYLVFCKIRNFHRYKNFQNLIDFDFALTSMMLLCKPFSVWTEYREPETQRNARPFGSSMAERQRFGCLDTWPYNCKQTASLRSPITAIVDGKNIRTTWIFQKVNKMIL